MNVGGVADGAIDKNEEAMALFMADSKQIIEEDEEDDDLYDIAADENCYSDSGNNDDDEEGAQNFVQKHLIMEHQTLRESDDHEKWNSEVNASEMMHEYKTLLMTPTI